MKKIRFFAISSLLFAFTLTISAQFKVSSNGKAAVASTNPTFAPRFAVGDNCYLTGDYSLGIAATPLQQNNKRNVGVEGYLNCWSSSYTSNTNIGVFGYAKVNKNHGRNFGVMGTIDYDYLPVCVGGAGVYATSHGSYAYNPVEAVDKSFGGDITQYDLRLCLGGNAETDPLMDTDVWSAYSRMSGRSISAQHSRWTKSSSEIISKMQQGNRVAITLNTGEPVAHSVVMKQIVYVSTTKINGTLRYFVMDPAGGLTHQISEVDIMNAYNVFYIAP